MTDGCLGRVVDRVEELGGVCLVTADHGNAEQLLEADGVSPHTAHTTNRVPLIVTDRSASCTTAARSPTSRRPSSACSGVSSSGLMTGKVLWKERSGSDSGRLTGYLVTRVTAPAGPGRPAQGPTGG